ncbi:MAG TPA: hypothetical protein VFE31_02020 [Opitutaceae bacterium]|jgi:hypothetical protein|nr:hypothetical protein [Opitutaceae bacterium]
MKACLARCFARLSTRLNVPVLTLVTLLQRAPVVRLMTGDCDAANPFAAISSTVLRAAFAAGTLGAVDSMAGATNYQLQASSASPLQATVGQAIPQVAFTVTNTINIGSWKIVGNIPPGLDFWAQENGQVMLTGTGGYLDATSSGMSDGYGGSTGGNSSTTPILSGVPTQAGTYTVQMTAYEYGAEGGLVSPTFTYEIVVAAAQQSPPPPPAAPSFTIQPASVTVESGGTAVLYGAASAATSYQWYLGVNAVPGATSQRLVLSEVAAETGAYTLVATNAGGSTTSSSATVNISSDPQFGHLVNLSVLTQAGSSHLLNVGFYNSGSSPEPVLVRASGPALAAFNVSNVLPDPTLSIIPQGSQTPLYVNDNWGTPGSNIALVQAADAATGAFALTNTASLDAALAVTLPVGGYSVAVSGNGATVGAVLAEVYDDSSGAFSASTTRLVNLSCLNSVSGTGTLSAGFYLGGNTARTVLVRASGPALTAFNVSKVMPDPQISLALTSTGAVLATNAGWGGDPQITALDSQVGAFALTNPSSNDSVVALTLPPGGYTATASSVSGAGGTVLVEIYEVP